MHALKSGLILCQYLIIGMSIFHKLIQLFENITGKHATKTFIAFKPLLTLVNDQIIISRFK